MPAEKIHAEAVEQLQGIFLKDTADALAPPRMVQLWLPRGSEGESPGRAEPQGGASALFMFVFSTLIYMLLLSSLWGEWGESGKLPQFSRDLPHPHPQATTWSLHFRRSASSTGCSSGAGAFPRVQKGTRTASIHHSSVIITTRTHGSTLSLQRLPPRNTLKSA